MGVKVAQEWQPHSKILFVWLATDGVLKDSTSTTTPLVPVELGLIDPSYSLPIYSLAWLGKTPWHCPKLNPNTLTSNSRADDGKGQHPDYKASN